MSDYATVYLIKRTRKRKGKSVRFWELKWFDIAEGSWKFRSVGQTGKMTKAEAERECERFRNELNSGRVPDKRGGEMTVGDLVVFDRQQLQGDARPATLRENRIAGDWLASIVGRTPITRVSPADVARLKAKMQLDKKSPATVAKTLRTLRAMFNRAHKLGLIRGNPFTQTKMPKIQQRQKRIYTPEESAALVEAAPNLWWKSLIHLALTSGLRRSELLNLHWSDIDFEKATVSVTPKRSGKFTVGSREYPIIRWETKGYETRVVPIPMAVIHTLTRYQPETDGSPYVFVGLERLKVLALNSEVKEGNLLKPSMALANNMGREFESIQNAARKIIAKRRGVGVASVEWGHGTLHDCRRTFGSHAAKAVMPHVLKEFMGHKDVKTTMDYYLAADREDAQKVRGQLGGLVTPPLNPIPSSLFTEI